VTRQVYEVVFAWTEMTRDIAWKARMGDEGAERVMFMMEMMATRWLDDPHLVGGLFDDDDRLHCTFYVCDDCGPPLKMNLMKTVRDKLAKAIHADINVIHGVGRNGEGHA